MNNLSFFIFNILETIHYQRTKWGSMIACNYFCFAPFMQGIIAIIWLAFFLICGYSKKNTHSYVNSHNNMK